MTDKQIIIDGVDVSGCENYGETMVKTHNCTLYDEYLRPCKGTNCYYKKWQRKEQECERTKERLESFQKDYSKLYQVIENRGYIKELDQLKAENDE